MHTPPALTVAARLARRQLGVISRRQLVAAGASTSAIDRLLVDGRLQRLHPGVYAIGHRALRREATWLAAVLAGGDGAVLSHRSAAEAWDLRADRRSRVELTVAAHTGRDQPGLLVHRCRLTPADVTSRRDVPLTTPARTLLDLADVVPRRDLARAVERSEVLRLFDGAAIADALARANGRRGAGALRAVLAQLDEGHLATRSELERRALELLRARELPAPAVNARVGGYEVDLLWRERRVVVELDGFAYHRSAVAFERDRRRDANLQARGYRVLRVTWRQLVEDPDWVMARVGGLLAQGASNQPR